MIKKNDVKLTAKQGAALILKERIDGNQKENLQDYFDIKPNGNPLITDKDVTNMEKFLQQYKERIYKILIPKKKKDEHKE